MQKFISNSIILQRGLSDHPFSTIFSLVTSHRMKSTRNGNLALKWHHKNSVVNSGPFLQNLWKHHPMLSFSTKNVQERFQAKATLHKMSYLAILAATLKSGNMAVLVSRTVLPNLVGGQ